MAKILGLDLGTTSIGWALVEESHDKKCSIIQSGVRVVPLTVDEKGNFEKGKAITTNADRTLKRSARRNLQRTKLRREVLHKHLCEYGWISSETPLYEEGKDSTHRTLQIRAKAATSQISLEELAVVLFSLNKKRGYKSSRKMIQSEEGDAVDNLELVLQLQEQGITPGVFCYQKLQKDPKKTLPTFYRSDLLDELQQIWNKQKVFHDTLLSKALWSQVVESKSSKQVWDICKEPWSLEGIKIPGNKNEQKVAKYQYRSEALTQKLSLEKIAIVVSDIMGLIAKSSGYLGDISDRSKQLYMEKITVGQYLWRQIEAHPFQSIKNQVFYRQDYMDEFERIWDVQKQFYPEALTLERQKALRDIVIFYQRPLRSQKGLISRCAFEKRIVKFEKDGKQCEKEVGPRVVPKSSPLFQTAKDWQTVYNYKLVHKETKQEVSIKDYALEQRNKLQQKLSIGNSMKPAEVASFLGLDTPKKWDSPLQEMEGNKTNLKLYQIYRRIAVEEGYGHDWERRSVGDIQEELTEVFKQIGVDPKILHLDLSLEGDLFDKQPAYQLWHLLYATQDDVKVSSEDRIRYGQQNVAVKRSLHIQFGFPIVYAQWLGNIQFPLDYGSLSAKALRKILPFLQQGIGYSDACEKAGYNHSNSMTREQRDQRILEPKMEILAKNELRNPVVEKILNQVVHVVNGVIDRYGKPDIVRVELARELKKGAKERASDTSFINQRKRENEKLALELKESYNISNPTKNDIVRLRLYHELKDLAFKDIYTNTYIDKEQLFSKEIEVEHILPKARHYDDSFSNKTLSFSAFNKDKGADTPLDFLERTASGAVVDYQNRVELLYANAKISKSKRDKLLMHQEDIPENFLERDLRNTQYISREATARLQKVFRKVETSSGSITSKLREEWGIMEVMKELNLPVYRARGLVEVEERGPIDNRREVEVIREWTKRNDHRHHAMDAITVAFTTPAHIQCLNRYNALYKCRKEERVTDKNLFALYSNLKEQYVDKRGRTRTRFKAPFAYFRQEVERSLSQILVSFKAKNKVVTRNQNRYKTKEGQASQLCLTPRGPLHKETVYAQRTRWVVSEAKIGTKMTKEVIETVTKPLYRSLLLARLEANGDDPKKAFTGRNSLTKKPLIDSKTGVEVPEKVKIRSQETYFTVRKSVDKDLKLEKIVDQGTRRIIETYIAARGGDPKKALDNITNDPIWQDETKTQAITDVRIEAVKEATPIHAVNASRGREDSPSYHDLVPNDYVQTGNNHHVAIFRDADGKYHEEVVSFYEAVARVLEGVPIVRDNHPEHPDWTLQFTLKQNEMFLLPSEDFNPREIDPLDPDQRATIAKHLYRVQNISSKYYVLTHHYETTDVTRVESMLGWRFIRKRSLNGLEDWVKVRINHLGEIVQVGEYR
ncbi:type II CRISPR RNA-guided endonuclease Cas9 [Halosquirtibacter laminarini]|uniref:Type II CRISPR RNA-guided endonuclease Cas9 n=1 Tax=Halosquirtibacter laminarini TaxID=3374600 RepID=A0AC61NP78_9BACT|nr:type II CRISPR RNA-guided endonuclease Cas9 [Prolixibacteraceae bacterium]